MIKQVRIRKSTVKFKINLFKLSIKNPSIENLTLLLFYIMFYFKQVNLACKTSGSNFKYDQLSSHKHGTFLCLWKFSMFMEPFYIVSTYTFNLTCNLDCFNDCCYKTVHFFKSKHVILFFFCLFQSANLLNTLFSKEKNKM